MKVRAIKFSDYKSFSNFSLSAKKRNVLVGPNNAGKSTVLDAFRIVFDALRFARKRTPVLKSQGSDGVCSTYFLPKSAFQTDLRYCIHNFGDGHAIISIEIENGNTFKIKIPQDGDLECFLVSDVAPQKNARFLRVQFPVNITLVPTLSPLEQNEELVQFETVERNRYGRLASRNFRNFWLHRTEEEFDSFATLVELGWPGTRLMRPEIDRSGSKPIVRMYFRDGPNVREVQWAGFGFQVWMQTMMHLQQAVEDSVLILDEPDIYLHPDLQHRLLRIVSKRVGQYFIATHSTEIINSVDPGDVLIVRPSSRSARRIRSDEDYGSVYTAIGSSENAQFARLARTKRVLYFEGQDNRLLSRLARSLVSADYLTDSSVTIMKTDGFANWTRVLSSAWVLNNFFEFNVKVAALFDRDYRCDAEVIDFLKEVSSSEVCCKVLPFKELENILLVPKAVKRVVLKYGKGDLAKDYESRIDEIFGSCILEVRDKVLGRRIGMRIAYELKTSRMKDIQSISASESDSFSKLWLDENFRRSVVPGKEVFSSVSRVIQEEFGVTLTATRVIDELDITDVDTGLLEILVGYRDFFSLK